MTFADLCLLQTLYINAISRSDSIVAAVDALSVCYSLSFIAVKEADADTASCRLVVKSSKFKSSACESESKFAKKDSS